MTEDSSRAEHLKLIEEARSSFKATNASASMIRRLADALEAQTGVWVDMGSAVGVETQLGARQPTEGDREALGRRLREGDDPRNTWEQATETQREFWRREADHLLKAQLSRNAVPDAATEWLRAERDAALAALERVRATLGEERAWLEHLVESGDAMPRNVIGIGKVEAALDGAPEPEVKP